MASVVYIYHRDLFTDVNPNEYNRFCRNCPFGHETMAATYKAGRGENIILLTICKRKDCDLWRSQKSLIAKFDGRRDEIQEEG